MSVSDLIKSSVQSFWAVVGAIHVIRVSIAHMFKPIVIDVFIPSLKSGVFYELFLYRQTHRFHL